MEVLGIAAALMATTAAIAALPPAAAILVGGVSAIGTWKLGQRIRSRRALRREHEAQDRERITIADAEVQRIEAYRFEHAPRELARQLEAPLGQQLMEFLSLVEHWRCATEDGVSLDVQRNRRSIKAVHGICLKLIDGIGDPTEERERLSKAIRHLSGQLADQLVRAEQAGMQTITLDLKPQMVMKSQASEMATA